VSSQLGNYRTREHYQIISRVLSSRNEKLIYSYDCNAETPAPKDSIDRQWNIIWIPVNINLLYCFRV